MMMSNSYSRSLVLNAARRDALDRRLVDVDQLDVRLVVDLVIPGFERHPARAEAVVLRDQLFGDDRVMDALTDLARDKLGGERVGCTVGQHVAEIALPDAETRLGVELLPERFAFLWCHFERLAGIRVVDIAARCRRGRAPGFRNSGRGCRASPLRRSCRCAAARTSSGCAGTRSDGRRFWRSPGSFAPRSRRCR